MAAYYNEFDPNAAAWLRELIAKGLIAPGDVDTRSIVDVRPDDLAGYTQCHFFAGIGVWSHALRLAGWSDDRPIWTGSCPCQPFSAAGKGGGFDDERHLWPAFHHLIRECRPDVVVGEQVASKDGLGWLDLVHADLEGAGYAVGAVDTCAAGFGAPHIRQRLWWVGSRVEYSTRDGRLERRAEPIGRGAAGGRGTGELVGVGLADANHQGLEGRSEPGRERAGELVAGPGGLASRLADTNGGDACAERQQSSEQHRQQPQDTGAGDVRLNRPDTNPAHPIPAPQPGADHPDRLDDHDSDGPRQEVGSLHLGRSQSDGSQLRPSPTNGGWAAADWLHCRDGRWRPVEPGTFPLAHAWSQGSRVALLRGAGNAIVAEQAEGFIASVMEAVR